MDGPLPAPPSPKTSAQALGYRGPGGIPFHPEPESFMWKEHRQASSSAQWHRTEWAMMAKEGGQERLGSSQARRDIPFSIYSEPGWSSTPQGPGSLCPALPLIKIPLAWPAASPSPSTTWDQLRKKQFSLSKTICICKYPVCAGCQGQNWEQSVAPATDLCGKVGN